MIVGYYTGITQVIVSTQKLQKIYTQKNLLFLKIYKHELVLHNVTEK